MKTKLFIAAAALMVMLWAGVAAASDQSLKPLVLGDLPAADRLLKQHGINGKTVSGMIVKADDHIFAVLTLQVALGNIQTIKILLGDMTERPALRESWK